jgi:hypothetical protein
MNRLTNLLAKIGIFKNDLDYHLIRTSMVIIFFFFGYQKWFQYEAQALIPYISHGPLLFWMYSVFGIRGATYFLGVAKVLRRTFIRWVLEQETGNSRRSRLMLYVYCDLHDHPVYAGRLGSICPGIPGYDRESRISNEGPCVARCVVLFAKAGRGESVAVWHTSAE